MSKRIKLIFTISLLLNIVLIAASAGTFYKHSKMRHNPFSDMRAQLSADAQDVVRGQMREGFKSYKNHRTKAREFQKEMEAVLKAENFDRDAYVILSEKIIDLNDIQTRLRINKTADLMEKLSFEDRQVMAKHIAWRLAGGDGHKMKKSKPRDGLDKAKFKQP